MKNLSVSITMMAVFCGFLSSNSYASRVALIIGNAKYQHESVLSNPINDARLIASTLKNDLNFDDVTVIENAKIRDLNRALEEFAKKSNNSDTSLIYFSGHGQQDTDRQNYLLGVDAQIEQSADLKSYAIESESLINATYGAKIRLVVLDACRDSLAGAGKTRSATKGLSRDISLSTDGLLVAYATEAGKVAFDGPAGGNSPYAAALSQGLKKNLPVLVMLDDVADQVEKLTQSKQRPTRSGNMRVNTYLSRPLQNFKLDPVATWKDEKTKRVWMRCLIGQTWDGQRCSGTAAKYDFEKTQKIVQQLSSEGWRLPSIRELSSLIKCEANQTEKIFKIQANMEQSFESPEICSHKTTSPKIDLKVHSNFPDKTAVWSGSQGEKNQQWGVYFQIGGTLLVDKNKQLFIKLVKD